MQDDTKPLYLDPSKIYASELEPWTDLWDNSLSLYENAYQISSQSVFLPYHSIQLPIAVVYMLTSSKWAKILPILFSYGDKGTGKTTFAIIAVKFHGLHYLFSPADTFASIRNSLDAQKWLDPEDKEFEKDGVILCWDNLHKETLLNDPKIYQLLLFGYNRATERIQIACNDGVNREYRVFCPKIVSSIHPLHLELEFEELQRRLIVIRHKAIEKLSDTEKGQSSISFDPAHKLDLDSICWDGIEAKYFEFWNDESNCTLYARHRTALTRRGKKSFEIPPIITAEKWTISVDLICTGLVLGVWQTKQEAIDAMAQYWQLASDLNSAAGCNALRLLQAFLDNEFDMRRKAREIQRKNGIATEAFSIPTRTVKAFLEAKQNEGSLDIPLKTANIAEVMHKLGWQLNNTHWVEVE